MMKVNVTKPPQRVFRPVRQIRPFLLITACLVWPVGLLAQAPPAGAGTGATSLPNAPEAKPETIENPTLEMTSRVVGYATNKSIVFPDIATREGPLSPNEKFRLFINESISPPYIISSAMAAGFNQAKNVPEGYGQDWSGYGCRFGEELARASSNAFFGSFVLPSVLQQDPRFFPQLHPTFWGSVRYSAQRVFITRTDSGIDTFNTSGIVGTMAAEALANSYLPNSERSASKSASRFGTDLAWRFAANMFKNYWPTMFRDMGLNRLKVIPDPNAQQPAPSSSD
jgi:hypothetical protein